MADVAKTRLGELLETEQASVVEAWVRAQLGAAGMRRDLISEQDLKRESAEFLRLVAAALASGGDGTRGEAWAPVRDFLTGLSRSRALQGFSPSETAGFVFSLRQPLFQLLQRDVQDGERLAAELWRMTLVLDELGLFTTEVYQRSREEVIQRQQQELMELSTPVVRIWTGVLAVPLIGTLDSARTQVVMESLLQQIVDEEASVAIIDITGVPTVDTLVAQHLLKTVAAARLMGAMCIISGIRPQIAQTVVHLGIDLEGAITKATLADAIALALHETGFAVVRRQRT